MKADPNLDAHSITSVMFLLIVDCSSYSLLSNDDASPSSS